MSGRRAAGGILQVPVMMDIQSLTHQDFTGLTKEQKKKAIEQLKLVIKMVDSKGRTPMGSDIVYIPEKKIVCIDLTSYYEDDEHPKGEADLCDFIEMFTDGYTTEDCGTNETNDESEILDDDDEQHKFDIDRCLECARQNAQKLQNMIEAVERAKAQGATKFAAIDFNDYDGDCGDDD